MKETSIFKDKLIIREKMLSYNKRDNSFKHSLLKELSLVCFRPYLWYVYKLL